MYGSRSGPTEAVAKVKSADRCVAVYVSVLEMVARWVLRATSFAGATAQAYMVVGSYAALITLAVISHMVL